MIDKIKEKFKDKILNVFEKSPTRVYIDVQPKDIPAVAKFLFKELNLRFAIASGIDTPGAVEILYHFSHDESGKVISMRTALDKKSLEIETISNIIKGAEWIEREIHELLGVNFKGHPNLKRLLLDEDWPEGKYPLRRDQ